MSYDIVTRGMEIDSLATISRDEGHKLLVNNRIANIKRSNGVIEANVDNYNTKLTLSYLYKIDNFYCSCNNKFICKHVASLFSKAIDMKIEDSLDESFLPLEVSLTKDIHTLVSENLYTRVNSTSKIELDIFIKKLDNLLAKADELRDYSASSDEVMDLSLEILNLFYNLRLYIKIDGNYTSLVKIFRHAFDLIDIGRDRDIIILNKNIYNVLLNVSDEFLNEFKESRLSFFKFMLERNNKKRRLSPLDNLLKRLEYRYIEKDSASLLYDYYNNPELIIDNKEFSLLVKALNLLDISYKEQLKLLLSYKRPTIYIIRYIVAIYKSLDDLEGLEEYLNKNLDNKGQAYFVSSKKEELLYAKYYLNYKRGDFNKALNILRALYLATSNIEYFYKALEISGYEEELNFYKDNHYIKAYMSLLALDKQYDLLMEFVKRQGIIEWYKKYEGILFNDNKEEYFKYYTEYIILNLAFSWSIAEYRALSDLSAHLIHLGAPKEYILKIINEIDTKYNDYNELQDEFKGIRKYIM